VFSAEAERALGCIRIVDAERGSGELGIIRGGASDLAAFAAAPGPEVLRWDVDALVHWQRGGHAVSIELAPLGRARPTRPRADGAELVYQGHHWRWAVERGALVAYRDEQPQWRFDRQVAALFGAFAGAAPEVPVVRLLVASPLAGSPRLTLLDLEGLEGALGTAAHSVPGTSVLATALGAGGVTVAAIHVDGVRDYLAVVDGHGVVLGAAPLPERPRGTVVLATTGDRVVALIDGRELWVLPL
jgi:hypothetical protein